MYMELKELAKENPYPGYDSSLEAGYNVAFSGMGSLLIATEKSLRSENDKNGQPKTETQLDFDAGKLKVFEKPFVDFEEKPSQERSIDN